MIVAALLVVAALVAWRWRPRPPANGPDRDERHTRAGGEWWAVRR